MEASHQKFNPHCELTAGLEAKMAGQSASHPAGRRIPKAPTKLALKKNKASFKGAIGNIIPT